MFETKYIVKYLKNIQQILYHWQQVYYFYHLFYMPIPIRENPKKQCTQKSLPIVCNFLHSYVYLFLKRDFFLFLRTEGRLVWADMSTMKIVFFYVLLMVPWYKVYLFCLVSDDWYIPGLRFLHILLVCDEWHPFILDQISSSYTKFHKKQNDWKGRFTLAHIWRTKKVKN